MISFPFVGKRVLLGVTGSISAFKIPSLIRVLLKEGIEVTPVITKGGENFITPLTLSAISGKKCYTDEDYFAPSGSILHIELARLFDLIVIAPCSADFISKLAHGQASDLLSSIVLATNISVYIFPAMNEQMWNHPATQKNVKTLKSFGYYVFEPEEGELACQKSGKGRLPEPEKIAEIIKAFFYPKTLKGKKVLITGGPTREFIDEIRFITNFSSGKMAFSFAKEVLFRGGEVFLVSGRKEKFDFPEGLPEGKIKIFSVKTTKEMLETCEKLFSEIDLAIFSAAPVDFTPQTPYKGKLKKHKDELILKLVQTPDIAQSLYQKKRKGQIFIGFALEERENLEKYAKEKKEKKGFDLVIANPLSTMGKDKSDFLLIYKDKKIFLQGVSKKELAFYVFEKVLPEIEAGI